MGERELVASEKRERRERWELTCPPHDSLRPSSLVNHYIFYYRADDLVRHSDGGIGEKTVEHKDE